MPASLAPRPRDPHVRPRPANLRARGRLCPQGLSPTRGCVAVTCAPLDLSPGSHKRRGRDPRRPGRPRTPHIRPEHACPLVLVPHDLVLVRDELVYVFQIQLFRHGGAAPSPWLNHSHSSRRRETDSLTPRSRVVSHGNRGDALRRRTRAKPLRVRKGVT